MDSLCYSDFSLGFAGRVGDRRLPVSGAIEVTRRCPMTCVHCYNRLPLGDGDARSRELSCEEHCRILDEITEAGCLWLLYTGGEIFARKDFLDIYTHAKRRGLLITLFTNGVFVTERVADHLAEWRPFAVEITLYGRTPESYERVTGIPGSFEKCMEAIGLLQARKLPLVLKTMALTINKEEVPEIREFVERELGCEFRFDAMLNPGIDCSAGPLAFRLSPREVVELDVKDPRRMAEWKRFADGFLGPTSATGPSGALYQCGGGLQHFAVDPYGKLKLCGLCTDEAFDLRRGTFREGWEQFLPGVRQKKVTRQTRCVACDLKALCGMCPANGTLENGDAEEPVDFLCQVAHLRAKALHLSVKPHGMCEYCGIEDRPARGGP